MIFIDTSAIYALADRADPNHDDSTEYLAALLESRARLLTHNYVLVEAMALLQRRLGLDAALALAADVSAFEVEWITRQTHIAAVAALDEVGSRRVSLVDHVSFLVMERRGVDKAFVFDRDFAGRGFKTRPRE